MRSPTAKRSSNRYIRVMLPLLPHTIVLHAVTYRKAVIQPLLHASNAACGHLPQSGHPTATYEYNALPHTYSTACGHPPQSGHPTAIYSGLLIVSRVV
jgi:hypothetical protein